MSGFNQNNPTINGNMKMTQTEKSSLLDRLRSYSSVFSRTCFLDLLHYDDYSFIEDRIKQFDRDKVGIVCNTYHQYIQYIYSELQEHYRNEYIYKNTFINSLLLKNYGVKDTLAINEFRVGNSIADIVLFNGTSKAFEIKTELDSNKRLVNQLADYSKIFKQCYIITHESLCEKYSQENEYVGIILLVKTQNGIELEEIRKAQENHHIDTDTLIRSIRTTEYKNIVQQYYGVLPTMTSFTMFEICSGLIRNIPDVELHKLFIGELKKRKSNVKIIETFTSELRQLFFAMNINQNMYQKLFGKLNQAINL